jgi:hypothetical protein
VSVESVTVTVVVEAGKSVTVVTVLGSRVTTLVDVIGVSTDVASCVLVDNVSVIVEGETGISCREVVVSAGSVTVSVIVEGERLLVILKVVPGMIDW